jgi:acetate CoA/acetoacetate CoA-transferase beta subunit
MDEKVIIAKRVALEMKSGSLVNLGIGLPTTVANYIAPGLEVYFQSENGIIGLSSAPEQGMVDPDLTDAGGGYVGAIPGAASISSSVSFGLIRGGHLDVTVLGGLEVDELGHLANWTVPGKMIPGMGGAMDLVSGAKKVIVAMQHSAKGKSKILKRCTLPLTSIRRVNLIVTELAVLEPTDAGLVLKEVAPGVTVEQVIAASEATLIIPENVGVMPISETEVSAARA